jgi:hypothetical protein
MRPTFTILALLLTCGIAQAQTGFIQSYELYDGGWIGEGAFGIVDTLFGEGMAPYQLTTRPPPYPAQYPH